MPEEIEIKREKLEGPGKIIIVKQDVEPKPQAVSRGLIQIGNRWFWATSLTQKPSLAALIRKILGQTTTTKFRNFLLNFGLTLQDLFDDNPEETTDYVKGICEELTNGSSPINVHTHTLRNLKEWLNSLKPGSTDQLRKTLQDTIITLENLLSEDELPEFQTTESALRKMAGNQ